MIQAQIEGDRTSRSVTSLLRTIGKGYRDYLRFSIKPGHSEAFDRDLLRSGEVVGILPYDPSTCEVVLVRQFRLGGHLALSRGEMVEIPAGRADKEEMPEQAALRECMEETGLCPSRLERLFDFLPVPALSDEHMTVFLAHVDASKALKRAGVSDEFEDIEVVRCPIQTALELVKSGGIHSAPTILTLHWLALFRPELIRNT